MNNKWKEYPATGITDQDIKIYKDIEEVIKGIIDKEVAAERERAEKEAFNLLLIEKKICEMQEVVLCSKEMKSEIDKLNITWLKTYGTSAIKGNEAYLITDPKLKESMILNKPYII